MFELLKEKNTGTFTLKRLFNFFNYRCILR